MARTRSLELLVQAIEQDLIQLTTEAAPLALALWSEADSMAGYLIHRDGRMVAVGDYQQGFSNLKDMVPDGLEDEEARSARRELGAIAGCLAPCEAQALHLEENLHMAFGIDAPVVEQAMADGRLSVLQAFELLAAPESQSMVQEGRSWGGHAITPTQDVVVSRLVAGEGGDLAWERRVVAPAGQALVGGMHGDRAQVDVEGGAAFLEAGTFTSVPQPSAHKTPRCGG